MIPFPRSVLRAQDPMHRPTSLSPIEQKKRQACYTPQNSLHHNPSSGYPTTERALLVPKLTIYNDTMTLKLPSRSFMMNEKAATRAVNRALSDDNLPLPTEIPSPNAMNYYPFSFSLPCPYILIFFSGFGTYNLTTSVSTGGSTSFNSLYIQPSISVCVVVSPSTVSFLPIPKR